MAGESRFDHPQQIAGCDHIKISLYDCAMSLLDIFRGLADPTRLRIMLLLGEMELAVGELAQLLDQSQPRVSRHIRILCETGLAERRKEGAWVFVKRHGGDDGLGRALDQLLVQATSQPGALARQFEADRDLLTAIRRHREASSADYFARHAGQWDALRSLHSDDHSVEAALLAMIGDVPVDRLLDIGTGTGRIAELLAPCAARITALDNSPEMLRLARTRLQSIPSGRLELTRGDFTALPFDDAAFDLITLHQVLHYAQQPDIVIAEAGRVLRAGGRIAIVDYALHDHEELRRSHAHARLGFADDYMAMLLADAGFEALEARSIPGGELTVCIWIATRIATAGGVTPIPLPAPIPIAKSGSSR